MPFKTDTATVRTIGIDTGKNTLHMIGLDEKGTIVLRDKVARGRIAARLVSVRRNRECGDGVSDFRDLSGGSAFAGSRVNETSTAYAAFDRR